MYVENCAICLDVATSKMTPKPSSLQYFMKLLVMLDPYWHRVYQSSQHEREHEGRCSIDKGSTNLSAASHSVDFSSKSRHCAQAAEETKLYAIKNSCRTLCIHLQKDQNQSER